MRGSNQATSKRRRKRALALFSAIALVVVAAVALRPALERRLRDPLERAIGSALGGRARFGALEVRFLRLEARFHDFDLEVPAPGAAEPLRVFVRSGEVRLRWSAVAGLAGGRLHIAALRFDEPVVESERSFWEAEREHDEGGRALDLRIDELVVTRGRFRFEDRESSFDLRAAAIELRAAWDAERRGVAGRASVSLDLRMPALRTPLEVAVAGGFLWRRHEIELDGLTIAAEGLAATAAGRVGLVGGTTAIGRGAGRLDLGTLASRLSANAPPMTGTLGGEFTFELGAEPFDLRARVESNGVCVGGFSAARASFAARLTRGRLAVYELDASVADGTLTGEAELALDGTEAFRLALSGSDLASAKLLDVLDLPLPLAGRVDGDLQLAGRADRRSSWDGNGHFSARATVSALDLPTGGSGSFRFAGGRLALAARAQAAAAAFDVGLELDLTVTPLSGELRLDGTTDDAGATEGGTMRILDALGVPPLDAVTGLGGGHGRVRARIGIGGSDTSVDLALDLEHVRWRGWQFERAGGELTLRGREVNLESLSLRRGEQAIAGHAALAVGPFELRDADLAATGVELQKLLELAGVDLAIEGTADARITVAGGRGNGTLELHGVGLAGERLDSVESTVDFDGDSIVFESFRASGPALSGRGRARFSPGSAHGELEIEAGEVKLADLSAVREAALALEGALAFHGTVAVEAGTLGGELVVAGEGLRLLEVEVGAAEGEVRFAGGEARFELRGEKASGWSADGSLGLVPALPLHVALQLDEASFDLPATFGPVSASLHARAEIDGPLAGPGDLAAAIDVDRAEVELGFERLNLSAPARITLASGIFTTEPIGLRGGGSDLTATVRYDSESDRLSGTIDGALDLGLLATPLPDVRASGAVRAHIAIEGPPSAPRVDGRLEAEDGRLRLLSLELDLDRIRFAIGIQDREVVVERISARSGNGEVSATGRATFAGPAAPAFSAEIEGVNLRLSYPEGFRADLDARLRLAGNADAAQLSGRVEILRGTYDRNLNLAELLSARSREFEGRESSPLGEWLGLDVRLRADNSLRVRNDLARLEGAADLEIGGTAERPEITGRATVLPGGQLLYRDVRYRIVSASIEFLERERLDPYLSLRADTRVGEYTINLSVEGTTERFSYELTSEPALATPDIIALLTTGRTLESGTAGAVTGDLASNYFAGLLTQNVTRQLENLVGVDRIEINPLVSQEGGDPTTRITIIKEISDDVVLAVSRDIGQTERQRYRINWFLSRKTRLAVQQDTRDGLGGEIGYYTRFGRGRGNPAPAAAAAPTASRAEAAGGPRIAEMRFPGVAAEKAVELATATGLRVGEPFSRSAMFKGVERIRRYYVDRGRIESRIHAEAEDAGPGVAIVFEIERGPQADVTFAGVRRRQARQLTRQLRELWTESVFPDELWEDSANLIRRYFQQSGHYAVDVSYRTALEDGVRRVRFTVDPGKPVRVEDVVVHGGESIPRERVRRQLLSLPEGLFSKTTVVPTVLNEDRLAVRQLYREEGFLRAEVAEPRVQLSASGESARIEIDITEGPRFHLRQVVVNAAAGLDGFALAAETGVTPGEVYSPAKLLEGESRLRRFLDDRGYADARVRSHIEIDGTEVVARYDVEHEGQKRIATIRIRGNQRTREAVVARELRFAVGEPVSREKILASQHALYRLGIFQSVRITYGPATGDDPQGQIVDVALREAPPYVASVSTGYDTEARLSLGLTLADENFRGRDLTASLQTRWSEIERRIQFSLSQPRFFGLPLRSLGTIGAEKIDEPAFSFTRSSAAFRLDHRIGERWSAYARYGFQNVIITDVTDPQEVAKEKLEDVQLGDFGVAFVRDTRDSPFAPTRGSYLTIGGRVFAQPLLSERSFFKPVGAWSRNWPLPRALTFASSIRAGLAQTFGTGDRAVVPISESFFLGGSSTVRGFQRDEIGPGDAMLLLNEELRFPIWKALKGLLFYDAGNVYAEPSDLDPFDLRHVLGTGLRFETPIGPLRLEYGRKLDREPGESNGEFFLAIGSAF